MLKSKDISLSLFKEPITPQTRNSLDIYAYRIDADGTKTPSMVEYAGLVKNNKPFCCDYLYINEKQAVLIEDTHLGETAQNILKELTEEKPGSAINNKKKQKYIKQFIRKKYCLKVYGSLLILCRLMRKYADICEELDNKTFSFWLIINDIKNIPVIHSMDLIPFLKKSLDDALKKKRLVAHIKIFVVTQLKEKLENLQ